MTVLHTGWTEKFGSGWESVFGGKKSGSKKPKASKASPKKKLAKKKPTAKKKAGR